MGLQPWWKMHSNGSNIAEVVFMLLSYLYLTTPTQNLLFHVGLGPITGNIVLQKASEFMTNHCVARLPRFPAAVLVAVLVTTLKPGEGV